MNIKNLDYLRGLKSDDFPDLGPKLYEALKSIAEQSQNTQQQANVNPQGQPIAPPAINSLKVNGQNGHFSIAIQDNNQIYRGIQYYVEHDTDPNFSNPQVIHLGDSRNHNVFLGNQNLYWRAYSSYSSSGPSAPAYHGSAASPLVVQGGGSIGGPGFQASQGSGTATAGQGLAGPGFVPFRSATGEPPVR